MSKSTSDPAVQSAARWFWWIAGKRLLLGSLGLASLYLGGCASAPLSYLDGQPPLQAASNAYLVRIVAVDGDAQFRNPVQVAPGPRWLVVEAKLDERASRLVQQPFLFKVEPCTHYYLGARRNSATATDWSLVVNSKDRVAGCSVEDELRKAGHPGSISGVMPAASAPK